jgi:hypothetical protein
VLRRSRTSEGFHSQGDLDLNGLGDEVLNLTKHREVVLRLDALRVGRVHPRDESSERGDTVTLSNAENRRVNVGRSRLERGVSVGDGATRVVVEVGLNVARNNTTERPNELVDLPRVGASDGVGDSDTVDANLVDGPVKVEEIDEVRTERVLRREADLDALGLDEVDDWRE